MIFELKSPILGFEHIRKVEMTEIDNLFAKLTGFSEDGNNIEIMLANPYILREYSFDIPSYIALLLELNGESNLRVYNTLMIQNPLENSKINFLAPIVFNEDNMSAAQIALSVKEYPHFRVAEEIKNFVKEDVA